MIRKRKNTVRKKKSVSFIKRIKNAFKNTSLQWLIGIISVVFVAPLISAVSTQYTQEHQTRVEIYNESITQYGKIKTTVWDLYDYCEHHTGTARDPAVVNGYLSKINQKRDSYIESNPDNKIIYYFDRGVSEKNHEFLAWLEINKNNICTETGGNIEVHATIRKIWSQKIFNPMTDKI